jgi:hypothetical protein
MMEKLLKIFPKKLEYPDTDKAFFPVARVRCGDVLSQII